MKPFLVEKWDISRAGQSVSIFGATFPLSSEPLSEVRNPQCLHLRMMSVYNGFHWSWGPTIAKESCGALK